MRTVKLNTNVKVIFDKYDNMKEVTSPYITKEQSTYNQPLKK